MKITTNVLGRRCKRHMLLLDLKLALDLFNPESQVWIVSHHVRQN